MPIAAAAGVGAADGSLLMAPMEREIELMILLPLALTFAVVKFWLVPRAPWADLNYKRCLCAWCKEEEQQQSQLDRVAPRAAEPARQHITSAAGETVPLV